MITIHTDGSCRPNPGMMGIGVVIEENGKTIHEISEEIGYGTNNIAEFRALITALEWLKDNNEIEAQIFMDSKMIQEGYNKEWSYKKTPHLKKLQEECMSLKKLLPKVSVVHVYREMNEKADELSTRMHSSYDYRNLEKETEARDLEELEESYLL